MKFWRVEIVGTVGLMQLERRLERKWLAGRRDGSKPKCISCLGSFVKRRCTEFNVNVSVFDHEHFCCCEGGCVAGITVLAYRQERYVQVWDLVAFGSRWWERKKTETF